ncbi:enoyl-CoA hydratase/isomerase family protein [Jatrophihabitans sp. DSM 45814]
MPRNEADDRGATTQRELETIQVARRGSVITLTLNRPERLNAIVGTMLDELLAELESIASDSTARVVVITGAGRGFCAGGDLNATGSGAPGRIETSIAASRRALRISELMRSMPQPVIAAINGPCAGAGLSWACAADLRIAAESATFSTAFVTAGVGGDHGITWLLPRIVGVGRAADLLLLSERFGAEFALTIGLISRIVPDAELLSSVEQLAARLLERAPGALAAMKANLREAQSLSLGESLDREAERLVHAFRHPDSAEAARAFLERRPPHYSD